MTKCMKYVWIVLCIRLFYSSKVMYSNISVLSTVPLKSKLPPLVSFLARRVSFLSRRFSFLASRVSFLSRITEAFSMAYITRTKPVTGNDCRSAVRCQIDGAVQNKICIDRLLDSYRTKVISNIERNYK